MWKNYRNWSTFHRVITVWSHSTVYDVTTWRLHPPKPPPKTKFWPSTLKVHSSVKMHPQLPYSLKSPVAVGLIGQFLPYHQTWMYFNKQIHEIVMDRSKRSAEPRAEARRGGGSYRSPSRSSYRSSSRTRRVSGGGGYNNNNNNGNYGSSGVTVHKANYVVAVVAVVVISACLYAHKGHWFECNNNHVKM